MLNKFNLMTRIFSLGILITLGFSLVLVWIYPRVKEQLYNSEFKKVRYAVETASGVLEAYAKEARNNKISLEEAKKQASESIKSLRYDKDEYFWINDLEPKMIMHPIKSEMDGTNLSENKDPNGKRLFVAVVDTVKSKGAGFVDYYWTKPGETQPVPKISYVKGFPEWGWIIGTGLYTEEIEKAINHIFYITLIAVILLAGVGLSLGYFMARSISRSINRVVAGLTDGADQVASASAQVSSASQSLGEGTSEQASGLEETSSSMEQMASMTKQNADNATLANTLMGNTTQVVYEANQAMKELTQSMQEITSASEETGKVIKTIDEIAFQTNLLALNAAVEAARAGEAGVGFAVVADEVRNLAMRAAEAAKNTSNLIEGTVKKIKKGSDILSKTNEAFEKVAGGSRKVGELMGEIAAASQEQAQGIDQINKAISEMDRVVQQNAANAEESASASEELNAQAEQMKDFVGELLAVISGNGNGFHQTNILPAGQGNGQRMMIGQQIKTNLPKTLAKLTPKGQGFKPAFIGFKEVKPEQVIHLGEGEFTEF